MGCQLMLSACQNESTDSIAEESEHLLREYANYSSLLGSENLVVEKDNPTTRARIPSINKDELCAVSINFPQDTEKEVIKLCKEAHTINDIIDIRNLSNAELIFNSKSGEYEHQILVSEKKVESMLAPMTEKSKDFLKKRGFSDAEIQEMLDENNADESQLIALTMLICENEASSNNNYLSQHKGFMLDFFATPAHAAISNNVYINCAMEAIGVDFIASGSLSTCKTWSKIAIKKAYKAIAKRMLGPVGVAIAVVEFSMCAF